MPQEKPEQTQMKPQHQFDIVGSLPLELVMNVARFLNPTDVIRSQRVRSSLHLLFKGYVSKGMDFHADRAQGVETLASNSHEQLSQCMCLAQSIQVPEPGFERY